MTLVKEMNDTTAKIDQINAEIRMLNDLAFFFKRMIIEFFKEKQGNGYVDAERLALHKEQVRALFRGRTSFAAKGRRRGR